MCLDIRDVSRRRLNETTNNANMKQEDGIRLYKTMLVAKIAAVPAITETSKKTLSYNAPTMLRLKSEIDNKQRKAPLVPISA
jgi:hypothetical protein